MTQREIDKLVTENNQIFDKALKENFGENYSFTEAAAKQLGLKSSKHKTHRVTEGERGGLQ